MTDFEWDYSANAPAMLTAGVQPNLSARRLRIFACRCCRSVWQHVPAKSRRVVETLEAYALELHGRRHYELYDLLPSLAEKAAAAIAAARPLKRIYAAHAVSSALAGSCGEAARCVRHVNYCKIGPIGRIDGDQLWVFQARQADELRCVAGNPHRPVKLARVRDAVAVAATAYDDADDGHAMDRFHLDALADALEDVGDCAEAVAHVRTGSHRRGCWVVDGLLGKR